jgi:dCTP deaminase
MILSDVDLTEAMLSGSLVIDPFEAWQLQPASIDLRLGDEFVVDGERTFVEEGKRGCLPRRGFALATTMEIVGVGAELVARVEGKSSFGRRGLLVHCTAGYVDPGFKGRITLELANVGNSPIYLTPGEAVCQLSVIRLTSPALHPYGSPHLRSRYQGQTTATEAREVTK